MVDNISSVIVLIDAYTRKYADTITYDGITKHASIISDIRELSDAYYDAHLVIFEPSIPGTVAPEVLDEMIGFYQITPYIVYQNQEVADLFDDGISKVQCSCKVIDWNLIYAVVHKDTAIMETYQKAGVPSMNFSDLFDGLKEAHVEALNHLYRSYLGLGQRTKHITDMYVDAQTSLANYKSVATRTTQIIEELRSLYDTVVKDNQMLSAMLSESYDVTFTGMYMNRPKVLYIKSISHVSGVDNLLMILYSVLTKQYRVSAKVVKLVDSANSLSLRYVPNIYFPLYESYSTQDVLVNDFLMSLSGYNLLFGQLMLNRSGLDVLILHDVRGTMNPAIDASLCDLCINEISSDYATMVEYDHVLSNYVGAEFNWSFEDVSTYTGTNTAKLANHPCVTKILDYLM